LIEHGLTFAPTQYRLYGVPGLVATVMLTNVGVDDQTDRRHEPVDPGMMEPDRTAHKKPS